MLRTVFGAGPGGDGEALVIVALPRGRTSGGGANVGAVSVGRGDLFVCVVERRSWINSSRSRSSSTGSVAELAGVGAARRASVRGVASPETFERAAGHSPTAGLSSSSMISTARKHDLRLFRRCWQRTGVLLGPPRTAC